MRRLNALYVNTEGDEGLTQLVTFINSTLKSHPEQRLITANATYTFLLYTSEEYRQGDVCEKITVNRDDKIYFFHAAKSKGAAHTTDRKRFMVNHSDLGCVYAHDDCSFVVSLTDGTAIRKTHPVAQSVLGTSPYDWARQRVIR